MRTRRTLLAGMSMLLSTMLLTGTAVAQEATPEATPGGPPEGFPVAIYQGTCDEPAADPAHEIGNAITPGVTEEGSEVETIGVSEEVVVLTKASATVEATLQDLGEEGHVVAVHDTAEDRNIIACGQIAGVLDDGQLVVALSPVDDSTVVGVAIFDDESSGFFDLEEGQVQATVYVFDTATGDEDTPES